MDLEDERYEGERRGLSHFLEEIHPLAEDYLGASHLLVHAIRRALKSDELSHLRHARELFNRLPRPVRQDMSQGIVAYPGPEPAPSEIMHRYQKNQPEAFVSISSSADPERDPWRIELAHEMIDAPALRVLIRPGTLPSTAARSLRDIADRLEKDKRLLSKRHWRAEKIKAVAEHSGADVG